MSGGAAPFPWDEVLHLALHDLRWTPDTLWRATPRELAAALGWTRPRSAAPSRADLLRLLAAHPDHPR